MAVTLEHQVWDNTTYNWRDNTTASAAPLQMHDKLSAWVTAVNANAGNTNKQLTILKGPADSTSANFIGWTIRVGSPVADTTFRLHTTSTTAWSFYASPTWTDNGTNGGYGASSGTPNDNFAPPFYTSGKWAEFAVATDTTDNAELFCVGYRLDNVTDQTYSYCLMIYKDQNGEWVVCFTNGSSAYGTFVDTLRVTPIRIYDLNLRTPWADPWLAPFGVHPKTPANDLPVDGSLFTVEAGHPLLFKGSAVAANLFGNYSNVNGGGAVICISNNGPYVKVA